MSVSWRTGSLFQRMRRFAAEPFRAKRLVLEATALLAIAILLVKLVPFRHWGALLGRLEEGDEGQNTSASCGTASAIGHAVRRASRHLPFEAVCLPQALAGSWMLRLRRIPGELIVGASRTTAGEPEELELHAWLTVAGHNVVGGESAGRYKELVRYLV